MDSVKGNIWVRKDTAMQYTQLSRRSAGVKSSDIDWEKQYLTFIPIEDAVFRWEGRATSGTLEYSINGGQTWVTIANGESTPTIAIGSKVIWRGNLKPGIGTSVGGIGTFSASGNYNAYGNTMSLLYYDNYYNSQLNSTDYKNAFYHLFYDNIHLLSAPLLPATTLASYCYDSMFQGCTSLTTAPELPSTTLGTFCYNYMFLNCTSLVTAPQLPSTTLIFACYTGMFTNCTSLVTAPELPATTLVSRCYFNMFDGCKNINYIKCLATDISASLCITNWVTNVALSGIFIKTAGMENWPTGTSGIPEGWTVVDNV